MNMFKVVLLLLKFLVLFMLVEVEIVLNLMCGDRVVIEWGLLWLGYEFDVVEDDFGLDMCVVLWMW